MRVVEIRNEAEFANLQPQWERLLENSRSNTIFLSWEWVNAWWAAYGTPGDLRVLTAYDDGGVLRGIAPLRRQSMSRYGQTAEALTFVGDGSSDSDYLDFLAEAEYEAPVMAAFAQRLAVETQRGTVLILNEIPESSANLGMCKQLLPRLEWTESDVPCGVVRLPLTWDDYLAMLRPRFRTKVRSALRNLEGREEVRFGFCTTPAEVERLLPQLFDLHTRRWAGEGRPGVFGSQEKRRFYALLSPLLLERNELRFSWLEWNGRILACQYGFVYQGAYSQLQEGFEPAAEHYSVGLGLRAWSIRELLKEGIREYDFLGGMGRHKSDWGAGTKISKRVMAAMPGWRNVLFRRGRDWETGIRTYLKATLPDKVVQAYARRSEPQPNGPAGTNPAGSWTRHALAACYMHSPLPRVVRPLRERYRFSLNGGVSCQARRQPSARILFYHRVNDERDPFFPAISTRLFEQEMRYIAAHYKVVSLSELTHRLADGSPEPVLAITMDDGYQDNYENAFPILQRYRLPATIFLATEGMDTGEALWFERLAHALKHTSSPHLDLEIDIPRRIWLRTEAERLAANDTIFGIMRTLSDSARRQHVDEILRQLAVSPDGRKGKMLTWDQARRMQPHGIDFGGHTVTHPFISKLTREKVMWEISESKRRIEEELQAPVTTFAYPSGREQDFQGDNKDLILSAGYRAAVTTIWGPNLPGTDPLELRRGGPWEETAAMFASKLDWYQLVE